MFKFISKLWKRNLKAKKAPTIVKIIYVQRFSIKKKEMVTDTYFLLSNGNQILAESGD